jgi:hypothetical protein
VKADGRKAAGSWWYVALVFLSGFTDETTNGGSTRGDVHA